MFRRPHELEILYIIDCCHAAGTSGKYKSSAGTIEVLAACGFETPSYGGPSSFTHCLIEELISMHENTTSFTVLELYMGVLARIFAHVLNHPDYARTPVSMRFRQSDSTDPNIMFNNLAKSTDETYEVGIKVKERLAEHEDAFWKRGSMFHLVKRVVELATSLMRRRRMRVGRRHLRAALKIPRRVLLRLPKGPWKSGEGWHIH